MLHGRRVVGFSAPGPGVAIAKGVDGCRMRKRLQVPDFLDTNLGSLVQKGLDQRDILRLQKDYGWAAQ